MNLIYFLQNTYFLLNPGYSNNYLKWDWSTINNNLKKKVNCTSNINFKMISNYEKPYNYYSNDGIDASIYKSFLKNTKMGLSTCGHQSEASLNDKDSYEQSFTQKFESLSYNH